MKFEQPNIHAIVLAAGLSRRMGTANKLLLPFKGSSIIKEVIHQLQATSINGITLVLGHQKKKVEKEVLSFDLNLVTNPDFAEGQSSSIKAGVKVLPEEVDGFLVCLGDMPKITTNDYQKLIDDFSLELSQNEKVILRPFQNKKPGHPVGFATKYKKAILNAQEEDGCRSVILANKEKLIKWKTELEVYFLDIDTEEEYEKVRID